MQLLKSAQIWGTAAFLVLGALFAAYIQYKINTQENLDKKKAARKSALSGTLIPPDTSKLKMKDLVDESRISGKYKTSEEILDVLKDRSIKGKDRENLFQEFLQLKNKELASAEDIVWITFGSNRMGIDKESIKHGEVFSPVLFVEDSPLIIKLVDGALKFSGSFRSLDGKIVAEIKDNEWQVNPNNYFKRNYDDNGLEVIDADGIMKFQVDFIDENNVNVNGFFKMENTYVLATNDRMTRTPEVRFKEKADIVRESEKLPLLFNYPEDIHFGERAMHE